MCKMSLGHIAKLESKEATSLQTCVSPYKQSVVMISFAFLLRLWLPVFSLLCWLILFHLVLRPWSPSWLCPRPRSLIHLGYFRVGCPRPRSLPLGYFRDPHGLNHHATLWCFPMFISPAQPHLQNPDVNTQLPTQSFHLHISRPPQPQHKLTIFSLVKVASPPLSLRQ